MPATHELSPGARVAVTGAAGFIGAALSRRLRDEGHAVVGVDVAGPALRRVTATGAEAHAADVRDPRALARALRGADAIVHAAAIVSEWGRLSDFIDVNVRGTRNVLDVAGGRPVVCLSSVAAWGYELRRDIADEDAPPRPGGNPYVDTKGAADELARRGGAVVVRPGDVYGPNSIPWVVRPLAALRSGVFRLPAPGRGLIAPVYVDDLVDCLVRALRRGRPGRAYTAWDGDAVTAAEFFGFHARMLGRERVPTLRAPLAKAAALALEAGARAARRPPVITRASHLFVSRPAVFPNRRAREELGWEPRVRLPEGMARTEAWARAEGLLGP